ncbi:zinc finger protein [Macleaya cordata]|uniref:Zinc finger protein n=1 Tax=Macleaya cordata TaxID=56857 RepID=A0A200QG45_MACCD|nr:zinc finger protein [Macleaya cordata]
MIIHARGVVNFPDYILFIYSILITISKFISRLLRTLGFDVWDDEDVAELAPPYHPTKSPSVAAFELISKNLPIVKFEDVVVSADRNIEDSCAVCLCEFESQDEIRPLMTCSHIFHRRCLDRWMDHGKRLTCPMCRTPVMIHSKRYAQGF